MKQRIPLKRIMRNINFLFILSCIILSIYFSLFSISIFWRGYHNMDLGQNMRYLDAAHDLNLVDLTAQGNIVTGIEAYQMGTSQMEWGFYATTGSVTLLVASILTLIYAGRWDL
ncbi:hypothetical protein MUP79_03340 [Candidatus Bathyarchaeota archaeon]|nr:hypothetical protein [Candidatus Bathyarchaeota archaeon]